MKNTNQDLGLTQQPESTDELKLSLNRQTSKISWEQLQRFYAGGVVIGVDLTMDLIDVASQFSLDNKTVVEQWLKEGLVYKVEDHHAAQWYEQNTSHWAVVVAPWVLVQQVLAEEV